MKKKQMISIMLTILIIICPIVSMLSVQGVDQSRFYLKGDADNNGVVNIMDVTAIQRIVAEMEPASDDKIMRANVIEKDELNISDATAIQRFLAEFGNPYSIAEKVYLDVPSDQPQLIVSNTTAKPGDSHVAVTVSVRNNPGISSLAFDVNYNTKALTLTSFEYNSEVVNGSSTVPFNANAQPTCLSMVNGSSNIEGDWVFATLYFDVKETAEGNYSITLSYDEDNIYNIEETNVAFDAVAGTITVYGTTAPTQPKTEYTVTFKDSNGNVISEQSVQEGQAPDYPEPPAIKGYVFKGWDKTIDAVTGDTIITAVYEEATNAPTFVVENVDAHAGDKNVAVNVAIKNNPGIASILLEVVYDKENLTLTNFTYNAEVLAGCSTVPYNANAFAPCLNMVNGTQNVQGDWTFATLYFDVNAGATGTCPITVSFDEDNVYNIDEDNIPFAITGGAINVK